MSFKHLLSTATTATSAAINVVGSGATIADGWVAKHAKQQKLREKDDLAAFLIEQRAETARRVDVATKQMANIDMDNVAKLLAAAKAEIEAM